MSPSYRHNQTRAAKSLADHRINLGKSKLSVRLSNDRALFIDNNKQLIIADCHFGKAAHFRKAGMAIPNDVLMCDLARLSRLIAHYDARQVIIAGDFFHAGYNDEVQQFISWQKTLATSVSFILVRGNHDRLAKQVYDAMNISVYDNAYTLNYCNDCCNEPITINHHPAESSQENLNNEDFRICGHIHPGVKLGNRRRTITLPCFVLDKKQLILPAFSLFTGLDTRFTETKRHNRNIFSITEDAILAQ